MENIFSSKLICIFNDATMAEARHLMRERRIRHLPVVTRENEIVGMLSSRDVTDNPKFQDLPVELFATVPVKFVTPDTPLSAVALRMISEKVSSLIVAERSQALGIITTDDLMYEFSLLLKEKEKSGTATFSDALATAGELCRKLADIGI